MERRLLWLPNLRRSVKVFPETWSDSGEVDGVASLYVASTVSKEYCGKGIVGKRLILSVPAGKG